MEAGKETKEEKVVLKINFKHDTKMNFPNEATLLDLKTQISKNFLIREDEYELFLGDVSLSKMSNKTTLQSLVEQYKSTNFNIKSYKNIFDLKKQLVDYNEFLDKNIKIKEDEIISFKENLQKLQNELKEIENKQKDSININNNGIINPNSSVQQKSINK